MVDFCPTIDEIDGPAMPAPGCGRHDWPIMALPLTGLHGPWPHFATPAANDTRHNRTPTSKETMCFPVDCDCCCCPVDIGCCCCPEELSSCLCGACCASCCLAGASDRDRHHRHHRAHSPPPGPVYVQPVVVQGAPPPHYRY